jgi:ketosteroid isomerase-like protein
MPLTEGVKGWIADEDEPGKDRAAIADFVARLADAVNRRHVAEFSALWADDAVWEVEAPMAIRSAGHTQLLAIWQQMLGVTQRGRSFISCTVVCHGDETRLNVLCASGRIRNGSSVRAVASTHRRPLLA